MFVLWQWLGSLGRVLLFTCLIEGVVTLFFSPRKRWVTAGLLGNLATNPLLNVCLSICLLWGEKWQYYAVLVAGEAGACLLEYYIYRQVTQGRARQCLLCSVIANGCSFLSGWIL